MTDEPQKEIASVVRNAVVDTLKQSAPGISASMREAIANSVMLKVRSAFPQFAAPSRRDAPDNHPTTPTSKT